MRFASYQVGDVSTNKVGVAAATGTDYAPAPDVDHAWRGGQVTLAPKPFSGRCGDGTFAFAVGQFATAQDRWRGYVKKFGDLLR